MTASNFVVVDKVECHYKQRCGCFSDAFCSESRGKIISSSDACGYKPWYVEIRLKMLPHHARDEHEWKDGKHTLHYHVSTNLGLMESNLT